MSRLDYFDQPAFHPLTWFHFDALDRDWRRWKDGCESMFVFAWLDSHPRMSLEEMA